MQIRIQPHLRTAAQFQDLQVQFKALNCRQKLYFSVMATQRLEIQFQGLECPLRQMPN